MYHVYKHHEYVNKTTKQTLQVVRELTGEYYSRLYALKCYYDECATLTCCICGGLNGCGEWSKYFEDLSDLIRMLYGYFDDIWLIKLDVDVLDDVFYAYVGLERE